MPGSGIDPWTGSIASGRSPTAKTKGRAGESGSPILVKASAFAQVHRGLHTLPEPRAEERYRDLFAAPSAEREDALRILVCAHLQAVEVLRLVAEAGIGDLDVVIALCRKSEVQPRIEPCSRAIVAARQLLACAVEYPEHRVHRRSAAPRLHFENPPFAGLAVDTEDVALGAAQRSVHDHRSGSDGLGCLDGVVAIGRRSGLRFFFACFGKCPQREQQDVGHAR